MILLRKILNTISIIILILPTVNKPAYSSEFSPRNQVKNGIAIYLGLLPAEMIEGHTASSMHGGLPTGHNRYHVAVAIFNDKTGLRINNATVQIRVNNKIGAGPEPYKKLEGMEMNGKFMYGNYFSLKTAGPYRIDVRVFISGTDKPIEVTFDYDFAHT